MTVTQAAGWRDTPKPAIYPPQPRQERGCSGLWASVADMGQSATSPNALDALQSASYLLWVLSGRKYSGICTATETYTCGDPCSGSGNCMWQVLELPSGSLRSWCSMDQCVSQRLLFLRNRPARELLSIVDRHGNELDLSWFSIWDRAAVGPVDLTGCGGLGCWDPCGATVTYTWGTPPPPPGRMAVLELADQFVKAVECPSECKLPERITSVSRQGVSFQVFDPQDFIDNGRTGLYSVDVFLKTVNPDKAQKRARVFSPDMPQAHARTWPSAPTVDPRRRWR